jgi:Uncharacterised nucleotidyltransferase
MGLPLEQKRAEKPAVMKVAAGLRPWLDTPEFRYAVVCLASELRPEPSGLPPAPAHLDWQKLYSLLSSQRLAAHFYALGLKQPGLWPDAFREKLRQERYVLLLYGDRCSLQVRQVLNALVAAKIPVIVLKGWALISTLYGGDYGQRFCEDIDLLVPPDRTDLAEAVLREQGYAGAPEVSPGYTRRFMNCRAYTLAAEPPGAFPKFSIGLHWGLTHYPYFDTGQVAIPELFERAGSLTVSGVNVLELAVEDRLVYTCAHLALHHRNAEKLMNYFEIATILQNGGQGMDWQELIERAGAWRYGVQLQNTLAQVNWLWPGLIPALAFERVQKLHTSRKERWIDWLAERTKGNAFQSALVELLAMPGLKAKGSASFRMLFPDKAYMQKRYGNASAPGLFELYVERFMRGLRGIF